jgi:hypothetical protein
MVRLEANTEPAHRRERNHKRKKKALKLSKVLREASTPTVGWKPRSDGSAPRISQEFGRRERAPSDGPRGSDGWGPSDGLDGARAWRGRRPSDGRARGSDGCDGARTWRGRGRPMGA